MVKKQLFLIIGSLALISVIIILVIRFIFQVPIFGDEPKTIVEPPTTTEIPISQTAGQDIWTGVLNLVEPPTLLVGDRIFTLKILENNTLQIFEGKGYQTGDTVNVMGSEEDGVINVSGLNKLIAQ